MGILLQKPATLPKKVEGLRLDGRTTVLAAVGVAIAGLEPTTLATAGTKIAAKVRGAQESNPQRAWRWVAGALVRTARRLAEDEGAIVAQDGYGALLADDIEPRLEVFILEPGFVGAPGGKLVDDLRRPFLDWLRTHARLDEEGAERAVARLPEILAAAFNEEWEEGVGMYEPVRKALDHPARPRPSAAAPPVLASCSERTMKYSVPAPAVPHGPRIPAFDVFLCHNSKSKPAVRELDEALRRRKLRPWLDERNAKPGQPGRVALEEAVATAGSVAVLVGADGLGPWQDIELSAALQEFVNRQLPVIPVLLPGAPEGLELPLFLRTFTWLDLRGGIDDNGLNRLAWGITHKLAPAAGAAEADLVQPDKIPFSNPGPVSTGRLSALDTLTASAGSSEIVQPTAVRISDSYKNPYQAGRPLPAGHPTYLERQDDTRFAEALASSSFIYLRGGFGTGKTSMMNQARKILGDNWQFFGQGLAGMRSEDETLFIRHFFGLFTENGFAAETWGDLRQHFISSKIVILLDDLGEIERPGFKAIMPRLYDIHEASGVQAKFIATLPIPIAALVRERLGNPRYARAWKEVTVNLFCKEDAQALYAKLCQLLPLAKHRDLMAKSEELVLDRCKVDGAVQGFAPRRLQCLFSRLANAYIENIENEPFSHDDIINITRDPKSYE